MAGQSSPRRYAIRQANTQKPRAVGSVDGGGPLTKWRFGQRWKYRAHRRAQCTKLNIVTHIQRL